MDYLKKPGDIKQGATIYCEFKGKTKKYKAHEIIDSGAKTEEVIVDQEKNHYFITNMAINGESWAKNVRFINP